MRSTRGPFARDWSSEGPTARPQTLTYAAVLTAAACQSHPTFSPTPGNTASYLEWIQRRHGCFLTEQAVNKRLDAKMTAAFVAVLHTAASIVAIDRVATVPRTRGMYAHKRGRMKARPATTSTQPTTC